MGVSARDVNSDGSLDPEIVGYSNADMTVILWSDRDGPFWFSTVGFNREENVCVDHRVAVDVDMDSKLEKVFFFF